MWWVFNSGQADKNTDLKLSEKGLKDSKKSTADEIPRGTSTQNSLSDRFSDLERSEEDFLHDWVQIPDNISVYSFSLSRNGSAYDADEITAACRISKLEKVTTNKHNESSETINQSYNGNQKELQTPTHQKLVTRIPRESRKRFHEIINNPIGLDVDSRILDSMQGYYVTQESSTRDYFINKSQGEGLTTEIKSEDSYDSESQDNLSEDLNLEDPEDSNENFGLKQSESRDISSTSTHKQNSSNMNSLDIAPPNFDRNHEHTKEHCNICEKVNEEIDALKRENMALKSALHNNYIASKHSTFGSRFDSFQKIFYALSSVGGFLWNALTEPLIFNHPVLDLCPMQPLPSQSRFDPRYPRSNATTSLVLPEIKESVYDYFLGSLLQNITLVEENNIQRSNRFKSPAILEPNFTRDSLRPSDCSRFRRFPSSHYNPQVHQVPKIHIYPSKRHYYIPNKETSSEIETPTTQTPLTPFNIARPLTGPESYTNTSQLSDSSFSDNEFETEKGDICMSNKDMIEKHQNVTKSNRKFWNEFMEIAFPPNLPKTKHKHSHYKFNNNQIYEPEFIQQSDNTIDTNLETIGKMLIDFEAYRQHLTLHSVENNNIDIISSQQAKKEDDKEQNNLLLSTLSTQTPPQSKEILENNSTCLLTSISPKNKVPTDITVKQQS